MTRRFLTIAAFAVAVTVAFIAGCEKAPGAQAAAAAKTTAQAATQADAPATVTAYINVSSGCQQATVDLLHHLAKEYKGRIALKIINFGSAEGAEEWQNAGLHCMTIQFNGSQQVTFPEGNGYKTVVFQMPVGFLWENNDLMAAFDALASGTLHAATQEELTQLMAPIKIDLKVRAQQVKEIGDGQYAQLVINGMAVARLYGPDGAKRAEAAKKALEEWANNGVTPEDLSTATGPGGWGIYENETLLLRIKPADAVAYGVANDPQALAVAWSRELHQVVMDAVGRARAEEQAQKAKEKAQAAAGAAKGAGALQGGKSSPASAAPGAAAPAASAPAAPAAAGGQAPAQGGQ